MARPKTAMPAGADLRALIDAEGNLAVRVTPGTKTQALEIAQGQVAVKVRARPEDGKANEAVRALLAQGLGVAPSRVQLVRGAASREKQFRISQ